MTNIKLRMIIEQLDCSPFIEFQTLRDTETHAITGIKIYYVDLSQIVEAIYPHLDPKNNLKDLQIHQQFNILGESQKMILATQMLITRYCLHRILTHFQLWQEDVWMYKTAKDYYGENVQTLLLKPSIAKVVSDSLDQLRGKSPGDKLEFVLSLEYGYVLPCLSKKKWIIKRIPVKSIEYSNIEHQLKCKHDCEVDGLYRRAMEDFPYPRGIMIMNPDMSYKIIDGYHRLLATPEDIDPLIIYCLRD